MELIKEIYKRVIQDSKNMELVDKAVTQEIMELTAQQKVEMQLEDYEKYRDILYQVAEIAKEEAFFIGFRYGVKMLLESIV